MSQKDLAYYRGAVLCGCLFLLHHRRADLHRLCCRHKVGAQQSSGASGKQEAVILVLSRPDVVQQAVAGVLSCQISLSLSNVEAPLVFAHAVRVDYMYIKIHYNLHVFPACQITTC